MNACVEKARDRQVDAVAVDCLSPRYFRQKRNTMVRKKKENLGMRVKIKNCLVRRRLQSFLYLSISTKIVKKY